MNAKKLKRFTNALNVASAHLEAHPMDYWGLALLSIPTGRYAGLAGRVLWALGKDCYDADKAWDDLVKLGLSDAQAHALLDYEGDVGGAISLLFTLMAKLEVENAE